MAGANTFPFCSRETFSATGVLALKNFSQFVVIWATAAEVDPVLGAAKRRLRRRPERSTRRWPRTNSNCYCRRPPPGRGPGPALAPG